MKNIPEAVDEIIRRSPFIDEALASGLINISSLSRTIQPEVERRLGKRTNMAAILMAINRRPLNHAAKISKQVKKFIHNLGDITVRSNLVDHTFLNSNSLRNKQSKLLKLLEDNSDAFYAISQGVYETTVILSSSYRVQLDILFKKEKKISATEGLSSITIRLPKENTKISGVYYYIFQKIAWEGINIVEVISTANEFTIVVIEEDVSKAFTVLKNLGK